MRNWKREAQGDRENAAYCDKKADELERLGRPNQARTYRDAAAESRESAENAEYRASHGGRSY